MSVPMTIAHDWWIGKMETYSQRHACPRCGSPDVQFAIGIDEMPDELMDKMVQALSQAEPLDDHPTDEDR